MALDINHMHDPEDIVFTLETRTDLTKREALMLEALKATLVEFERVNQDLEDLSGEYDMELDTLETEYEGRIAEYEDRVTELEERVTELGGNP